MGDFGTAHTDIAEFNDVKELKQNYLKYFEVGNPKEDWEIMDFEERIQYLENLDEDDNDSVILAVNKFGIKLMEYKNMENPDKNPVIDLFKKAPNLPIVLCVKYI